MRPTRLVLLALVVLGVGAYIVLVERHAPTTDELAERKDKLFATLDQEAARRVVVDNSHGHFELEKQGTEWRLTAPVADDAREGAVTSLLSSLRFLKAERTLDVAGLSLKEYGLDPPALSVTVTDDKGGAFTLKLGGELPLGNTRAAITDGKKVFIVNKYIASDLDRDLAGWRSDQLVQVWSSDVAALTVVSPAGRVALAHSGSVWTLTEPLADLADRDRAEGLVSDINAARIKEFLDGQPDLAALGLTTPRAEVTIVRKDKPPVKLEFGLERDQDGAKQVACRRGERVFWVDANAAARTQTPPEQWRSPYLVRLDTWAVEQLEITAGGASAKLERKDGQWRAAGGEVDSAAVSRRLNTLADLKVVRFDVARPTGDPIGTVKATTSDGTVVEASFFPAAAAGERVAVVPGRAGALAVDAARVAELLEDPAALAAPRPTPSPAGTPSGKASGSGSGG